ncbi:MAG: hemerythrin domain-containing protein [Woeseia sp.]|nr:hemerythrin domain-containing protein [Woeseia sp.]
MNIYQRLTEDHGKQRGMAAGLAKTEGDSAERNRLFEEFCNELEAHAAAEEQTFYAELIATNDGQEKARHSVAEHKQAADLIKKLQQTDMSSSAWLQTFKKLKEEVEHHVDEEENEVFPLAQQLISEQRANELADEFAARKEAELSERSEAA